MVLGRDRDRDWYRKSTVLSADKGAKEQQVQRFGFCQSWQHASFFLNMSTLPFKALVGMAVQMHI